MTDLLPSRIGRDDFQKLSEMRISDAQLLLNARRFQGAYYLAGYAIECALKAAIAKRFREHDFPDKEFVKEIYNHNVKTLLKYSELSMQLEDSYKSNKDLEVNWGIIKEWSEATRYEHGTTEKEARDLVAAVADPINGLLSWIKTHW